MAKPHLSDPPRPEEIRRLWQELGPLAFAKRVGPFTVGTSSTKLAHGMKDTPRGWVEESPGAVRAFLAAAPDAQFIYARAAAEITDRYFLVY